MRQIFIENRQIEVGRIFIRGTKARTASPGPNASRGSYEDFRLYCVIGNKAREGTFIVLSFLSWQNLALLISGCE